jgi:hypothetical protein
VPSKSPCDEIKLTLGLCVNANYGGEGRNWHKNLV